MNPNRAALLQDLAQRYGRKAALVDYGGGRRALSFQELEERTARLAAGLRARGLQAGQKALIFVPMSLELYVLLLACWRAGLCVVFVDAWADRKRLDAAVATAQPDAFFGSWKAQVLRLLSPAIRSIPQKFVIGRDWSPLKRLEAQPGMGAHPVREDDAALITFTTGSTGKPKAAVRSHGFLAAQHAALLGAFGADERDVNLVGLPVLALLDIGCGRTSVLPDFDPRKPADIVPEKIWTQIVGEPCSSSVGSPAFYERLADWCIATGKRLPLKHIYTGGAAVPPALARKLALACEGDVQVVYGSTEAEPISHVGALALADACEGREDQGLLAGKPAGIDLKIMRPVEGPVELGPQGWAAWEQPQGQSGEVVVAGAHVNRSYLNDPEAVRQAKISDGDKVWHRTGDAAWLDAEGRLWLMGRVNERVERGGATYWPQQVEARLRRVAGVRFSAYLSWGPATQRRAALVVEADAVSGLAERLRAAAEAPVDDLLILPQVARDPRHASKADFQALKQRLEALAHA